MTLTGFEFKGKVAIVTGGARGIGRAISLQLASYGASIIIADNDKLAAQKTASETRNFGQDCLAVKSDVSKSSDVKKVLEQALATFKRVDFLVNNAGIGYATGSLDDPSHVLIENLTEEEWDRVLNVNLKSVFLFCHEVAPIMKHQRSGKIVNISSVAAFTGHGESGGSGPAYGVSKAGIVNLTKTLARQLGPFNVNVNCVAPGSVPETAFYMTQQEIQQESSTLPLRRLGKATNIADAVTFLCSNSADWITGQTINVNGGEVM